MQACLVVAVVVRTNRTVAVVVAAVVAAAVAEVAEVVAAVDVAAEIGEVVVDAVAKREYFVAYHAAW